jgi:hypothetical protein
VEVGGAGIDQVRLGAVGAVDGSTSGTFYVDTYGSWRSGIRGAGKICHPAVPLGTSPDCEVLQVDLGVSLGVVGGCEVSATVTNSGPRPEPAAVVTVTFASASVFSLTPNAAASSCVGQPVPPHTGQLEVLRCDLGSLLSGGNAVLSWTVDPSNGLDIDAVVSGDAEDPNAANDEDQTAVSGCPVG